MNTSELLRLRLHHQQITSPRHSRPQDVVRELLAMQAQEYAMAKWAIALRMSKAAQDAEIERAFNAGEILRTHVLRPTWHFVAPEDIRWLLALSAPRVHVANGFIYRQFELDAKVFKRSDSILTRALEGGRFLTRATLQDLLARAGIKAAGPRLAGIVMHAELEGLICSGPRVGRQFTYALLDERAPAARPVLPRENALEEFSRRYFATRGPATAQDFATWSGLTLRDARAGMESLGPEFERVPIDGQVLAFRPVSRTPGAQGFAFLMPDYDEYGMSYKDRSALAPSLPKGTRARKLAFNRMIVADGQIVGSWQRTVAGKAITIDADYATPLSSPKLRAVAKAMRRFTAFAGV